MSLLSGVAFFFLYALAAGALFPYVPYRTTARFVLTFPINWSSVIYHALPIYPHAEGPALFFITFIPNVVFYGLLTYALLAWSSRRRLKLPLSDCPPRRLTPYPRA